MCLRERWRRQVYRSPLITDSTRVLLLNLSEDMRDDGYVEVPRTVLADRLDRTERRVSARLAEAVDAKLLDRVSRGQKGRTAVYRAMLPDEFRVTGHSTLSDAQGDRQRHPEQSAIRHPETPFRVSHGGPTSSKGNHREQVPPAASPPARTSLFEDQKREVDATGREPQPIGATMLTLIQNLRAAS